MTEEKDLVMRAVTCDADVIKKIKSIVSGSEAMLTEVELLLSNNGIALRKLDNNKAAMVHWSIPSSAFAEYEYGGVAMSVITLNADDLKRATSTAKKRLEFQLDSTDPTYGKLMVIGHSDFRHQETLHLLTPADFRQKKPNLPFTVGVTIKGKTLKRILKSVAKVSNHVKLTSAEKNKLEFDGKGDHGEFNADFYTDPDECVHELAYWKDLAVTMYHVEYLQAFQKFIQNKDAVFLEFAKDKPIKLSMLDPHGIKVELILAPRVERRGLNMERSKL